jgi:penicillin-binding protein 1C
MRPGGLRRKWGVGIALVAIAGSLALLAAWARLGPLPEGLLDPQRFTSTTILDRNGEVLFEGLSTTGTRSDWLAADALPEAAIAAIVAAEDHRFFAHPGVDPVAIGRAALANLRAGRIVEGGSTISQQTAKLLLANEGGSGRVRRKLRETVVALRLERKLEKREIVALYLNLAPFGNQMTGIRRASRGYFGLEPERLSTAQMALLAGLPQRPSALDPRRHPERARARQREVLRRMAATGAIDERTEKYARAEPLTILGRESDLVAPHLVTRIQEESRGKRLVRTTIDAGLQREVRGIIQAHAARLRKAGAANIAVAVLDNRSGDWLAWEGSGDYFDAENGGAIDGILAPRQPGSALKPFAYAAAFDRGYGAASLLFDVESSFPTAEEGIVYVPRNYDGIFRGPMLARSALAGSLNVPAVRVVSEIGVPSLLGVLRAAGISTLDRSSDWYGLGAVLGGGEVRLSELIAAYAMLARDGVAIEPRVLLEVDGERVVASQSAPRRVVSPEAAFLVADILDDDRARAFAFGRGGSLELPFPAAVKTGTSQSYRDNWTIGFTPEVTVGVWVGNFDRAELRTSSGVTGAAPVFHDVMLAAHERIAGAEALEFAPPASLARRRICLLSGMAPSFACPAVGSEWMESEPSKACNWHRRIVRSRADGTSAEGAAVDWPAELSAWAAVHRPARDDLPLATLAHAESKRELTIVHPAEGAVYLIDPTLRTERQTVALRAAISGPRRNLTWSVNGVPLRRASSNDTVDLPLRPGELTITVQDDAGRKDAVKIRAR